MKFGIEWQSCYGGHITVVQNKPTIAQSFLRSIFN